MPPQNFTFLSFFRPGSFGNSEKYPRTHKKLSAHVKKCMWVCGARRRTSFFSTHTLALAAGKIECQSVKCTSAEAAAQGIDVYVAFCVRKREKNSNRLELTRGMRTAAAATAIFYF